MQPRILRGLVAHSAFSLIEQNKISSRDSDAGAHAIAIRLRADQENLQPVIRIPAVIAQ